MSRKIKPGKDLMEGLLSFGNICLQNHLLKKYLTSHTIGTFDFSKTTARQLIQNRYKETKEQLKEEMACIAIFRMNFCLLKLKC
jgi:hypothetical protein